MPKRWLSRRGRTQNTNLSYSDQQARSNKSDFDFAFGGPSQLLQTTGDTFTALPHTDSDYDRPTTAGGIVEGRSRKKLKIDVVATRPQTSEGHRMSTRGLEYPASRSHDDLIGVAFGSPSHPPITFGSMAGPISPGGPNHAFRITGPFPESTERLQPKKWKMIGSLFKARNNFKQGRDLTSAGPSPAIAEKQEFSKSNEHLPKNHWFKNKPAPPEQPTRVAPSVPFDPHPGKRLDLRKESEDSGAGKTMLLDPTPIPSPGLVEEVQETTTQEANKLFERPTRMSSLPKLELAIPKPMIADNGDPLYRNVFGKRSSSLLARRSRTLESLKSSDDSAENYQRNDEGKAVDAKKRLSTPTMPKAPFAHIAAPSPTSSKYSLFPPAAPAPIKIVGRVPPETSLKRSTSSPARLSPMSDTFPRRKPVPTQEETKTSAQADASLTSPEDNTASTDQSAPWSNNHSVKSSVSSSTTMEEIFFDVKSFRDSKGLEDGQHFVMSRPDSAVVQLARSRSKLNAATRVQKQQGDGQNASSGQLPTKLAEYTDRHISVRTVNSAIFDAAIAEVEKLTCPSTINLPLPTTQTGDKNPADRKQGGSPPRDRTSTDTSMKLLPPDPVLPGRQASKSRRENIARALPSPITEEASPNSNKTPTVTDSPVKAKEPKVIPRKAVDTSAAVQRAREKAALAAAKAEAEKGSTPKPVEDAGLTRVKMIKRVDSPVEDSPTIPQSPPPRKPLAARAGDEPPPVPEKDAKFIPISKFAAKTTFAKVEGVGIRPARLVRATTDILPSAQTRGQVVSRTARSDTVPKPSATSQPVRPVPEATKSDFTAHQQLKTLDKGPITAVTAVVHTKPAAEVSVARTISLSRKQSARVMVPGPKLAARRAEEDKKRGLGIDSATTSAAGTPIIGHDTPRIEEAESASSTPQMRPGPLNSNPSTVASESFAKRMEKEKERARQEKVDRELIEKFKEQDKTKWDLVDQRAMSPVVVEGQKGHKPGLSMNLVLETA